jgi:microcystin-dependent protein
LRYREFFQAATKIINQKILFMSTPFLGVVRVFAFNFPPRGYALCNGQLLAINTNQALFALLGTTYGGNGTTNFALPNLQGRAPIHFGQGAGLPSYALGQTSGAENHTLIATEMPQHTHQAVGSGNNADQTYPPGNTWAKNGSAAGFTNAAANGTMAAGSVSNAGGSQPHNNMSPYLVVNYSIALQGIFPSRN